jgi:2-iminobutanoate/2-iminopropanoate deaminase
MPKQAVKTPNAAQPIGPYSQAVMVEGFLFVSGQGALDPNSGRLVGMDIESQTRQTLTNVKNIVEASGLSMRDIVRTSIYLKNMKDFKQMNEIYKSFFTDTPPARTTVQVELPLPDMLIEVDVIAHLG